MSIISIIFCFFKFVFFISFYFFKFKFLFCTLLHTYFIIFSYLLHCNICSFPFVQKVYVVHAAGNFFSRAMKSRVENASPRWVAVNAVIYYLFICNFYQSCISLETNILKKHDTCTWQRAQEEGPEKRTRVLQSAGRHAGRIGREKQAGQIRESRKRGRLQFALWSSLRNETADWRDGVFVRFTRRKKWRRLRAILLMSTSLWGRNALLTTFVLHGYIFSKSHEKSY